MKFVVQPHQPFGRNPMIQVFVTHERVQDEYRRLDDPIHIGDVYRERPAKWQAYRPNKSNPLAERFPSRRAAADALKKIHENPSPPAPPIVEESEELNPNQPEIDRIREALWNANAMGHSRAEMGERQVATLAREYGMEGDASSLDGQLRERIRSLGGNPKTRFFDASRGMPERKNTDAKR